MDKSSEFEFEKLVAELEIFLIVDLMSIMILWICFPVLLKN